MNQAGTVVEELDDWEVLCSFLPEGWEQKARDFGALTRARGISGAGGTSPHLVNPYCDGLLVGRDVGACGTVRIRAAQSTAVYKRLRSAEEWLRLAGGTDALGFGNGLSIGGTARAGGRCHIDL